MKRGYKYTVCCILISPFSCADVRARLQKDILKRSYSLFLKIIEYNLFYFYRMKNILYIVSFIEGGALMAVELLGAKLFQPYFGQSLYVWSAVLAVTVGALSLGYAIGAKLSSSGGRILNWLKWSLFLPAVYVACLTVIAPYVQSIFIDFSLQIGIILTAVILTAPSVVAFGTVTPLIVQFFTSDKQDAGNWAGTFYFISTLGGVFFTFLYGFYIIPTYGVRLSLFLTSGLLIISGIYVTYYDSVHKTSVISIILLILTQGCSLESSESKLSLISGRINDAPDAVFTINKYDRFGNYQKLTPLRLDEDSRFEYKITNDNFSTIYTITNNVNDKEIVFYYPEKSYIDFETNFLNFDVPSFKASNPQTEILSRFRAKLKFHLSDYFRVKNTMTAEGLRKKLDSYSDNSIDLEKRYDISYMDMKEYIRNFADTVSYDDLRYYAATQLAHEDFHFIKKIAEAQQSNSSLALHLDKIVDNIETWVQSLETVPMLLEDLNGKSFKLFTGGEKYTVVLFWASWCYESNRFIKKLNKKIKADKSKQTTIVSVSLDSDLDQLKEKLMDLEFKADYHYCDSQGWDSPILKRFPVNFLPSVFVLDPQGKIYTLNPSSEELIDLINNLENSDMIPRIK